MSRLDPSKADDAREAMKLADKALQKTLFKWAPDYVEAETHLQRAGRGFKAAGLIDSAVDAWRKAADCLYRLGNLKAAAVTLESAAREVSVGKGDQAKTEAARLYAEAAGFLQESGEVVRAADLKMRASKLCESFDQALAMRFIDECISIFDGDKDKDVYAVDPLRKAMQAQLSLGKHASAMRTMDRLWSVWTRLDQKHNLYKIVLSRVVLLLASADPVSAQREYDSKLDTPGFAETAEAAASEDLLQAYNDIDAPALAEALKKHNCFNYLEPAVTKLAKGLAAALEAGGNRVGVSKAEEAANEAVHFEAQPTNAFGDGFVVRTYGGGGGAGGGSAAAGRAGPAAEDDDEEDKREAAKAAAREAKESKERASLFSRRSGGDASAAARNVSAADDDDGPAMPTRAVTSAPAAALTASEADDAAFGDGADDIDSAFASMGVGETEFKAEQIDEDGIM